MAHLVCRALLLQLVANHVIAGHSLLARMVLCCEPDTKHRMLDRYCQGQLAPLQQAMDISAHLQRSCMSDLNICDETEVAILRNSCGLLFS